MVNDSIVSDSLLRLVAAQAVGADRSRRLDTKLTNALRESSIMGLTATAELGGTEATVVQCGEVLEAVTARCSSTGWVLMNHLGQFHLIAGLLGPEHQPMLRQLVTAGTWLCFPAGGGTAVRGVAEGDAYEIHGNANFGSGARYADKAGVIFFAEDVEQLKFTLLDLRQDGVTVNDDWHAMSMRASATDSLEYDGCTVPVLECVDFPVDYRTVFRRPEHSMIAQRYREDWMAISNLWLGYMGIGLAQACLDEVVAGIRERVSIMGTKVADQPNVHMNLGHAQAKVQAARAVVQVACEETDRRIELGVSPTEAEYLSQLGAAVCALEQCDTAMRCLVKVVGGNGLRQGLGFERRWRDFQALPIHINTHPDRVSRLLGRQALDLTTVDQF